uniref:Uncharacterized protein n=1 Tax=Neolamprologus brichardi TaxID=32507 RepID=A0A3Q4I7U3_NEOBR
MPPKAKSKKKGGNVKSSTVMDGLSTEDMSKDQVRAANGGPSGGPRPGPDELLPAGERQDPGLLGDLQEEPGQDEGRAEEQEPGER